MAKPADRGLIVGRMDWHFPVLYVNAVSYHGLMDAARLADRPGSTSLRHVGGMPLRNCDTHGTSR